MLMTDKNLCKYNNYQRMFAQYSEVRWPLGILK